jgi:hypothetical protein
MARNKPSEKPPKPGKPEPLHPDHPLMAKLADKATKHQHQHGVMADLLSTPPTMHIVALIDQVHHQPNTAASAQKEGDERLVETLDGILAICEHARDTCLAAGLPVPNLCTQVIAMLEPLLAAIPPVPTQLPA